MRGMKTTEDAKLILSQTCGFSDFYTSGDIKDAFELAMMALDVCEVWYGAHGQVIVMPKGTLGNFHKNEGEDI